MKSFRAKDSVFIGGSPRGILRATIIEADVVRMRRTVVDSAPLMPL